MVEPLSVEELLRIEAPKVTLWSKPGCVQCRMAERFLKNYDVEYDYLDITLPEHADRLDKATADNTLHMPLIDVNGEFAFSGNDPDRLKALAH